MKNFYLLLFLFSSASIFAQERYVDEVFCDIAVIEDVLYASQVDFNLVSLGLDTSISQLDLEMDLYLPVGDNLEERPFVVYLHTGNFLPHPANGVVGGTRQDSCAVEISKQLARRGFVVANADYRSGWNPLAPTEPERAQSIIRAAYRGIQDARTLNRFMRKDYENGNQWGIDTSRMVIFGQGTGGYIAYGCAGIDSYDELLVPKFFVQGPNGLPIPMVTEEVDGNIYGSSDGINEDGVYVTIGRYPGYSSDYHVGITLGGAIGDSSWVDENTIPMINVQTPEDAAAAYHQGIVVVSGATVDLNVVEVQGAYIVSELLNQYGVNDALGDFDDECTQAALAWTGETYISPFTGDELPINNNYNGLLPLVTDDWSNGDTNSSVWEWFDPTTNANTPEGITETMAEIKANALESIETIMCYSIPRVLNVLDLDGSLANSLGVSNTALDFGSAEIGDSRTLEVSMSNPYDVEVEFTPTVEAPFSVSGSTVIAACGEGTFMVNFDPMDGDVGDIASDLVLSSPQGDITIALTGFGAEQPVVSFGINGQGVDFDPIDFETVLSSSTEEMTITVNNTGTVALNITDISINGDGAFTTDAEAQELPVGGSVDIVVAFTPNENDGMTYTAELVVTTDDAGSLGVPLSGEGIWAVGVEEIIANSINIFPNPSNGQFNIDLGDLSGQKVNLTIYDNAGRTIVQEKLTDNNKAITGLNAGVYFVNLQSATSSVTKKVVIQ